MKPLILTLSIAIAGASSANAFAMLPFTPWTLEFPTDGAFDPKPTIETEE